MFTQNYRDHYALKLRALDLIVARVQIKIKIIIIRKTPKHNK
jgi:hypothetical protein